MPTKLTHPQYPLHKTRHAYHPHPQSQTANTNTPIPTEKDMVVELLPMVIGQRSEYTEAFVGFLNETKKEKEMITADQVTGRTACLQGRGVYWGGEGALCPIFGARCGGRPSDPIHSNHMYTSMPTNEPTIKNSGTSSTTSRWRTPP